MGTLSKERTVELDALRKKVASRLDEADPGVWVVLKRYDGSDTQAPYRDYRAVISGGIDRKRYMLKACSRGGVCELKGMRLGGK